MSSLAPGATGWETPIRLARRRAFTIGAVTVDPALRQLAVDGRFLVLEPRIMQVLVALADADGDVVSRDQLVMRCWDGRIVGDNALHRAVSRIRSISTDFAAGAFCIETIPKVGYRLVVDAKTAATRRASDPASPEPEAIAPSLSPPLAQTPAQALAQTAAQPGLTSRRAAIIGTLALSTAGMILAFRPNGGEDRFKALLAQSEAAVRLDMPDSTARGVGFLEEAITLKPSSPLAWGRLALARTNASHYAAPERAAAEALGVQEAAARALALDPRQPDALAALALLPSYFGDWSAAEARMRSVLAVDAEHLPTRDAHDFLLAGVGRMREAALSRLGYYPAEPLHAGIQFRLVYAYWNLDRIGDADRAADRALQLWPKHPGVWFARLWTLAFTGRADRALAQVEDAPGRPPMPETFTELLRLSMKALVSGAAGDIGAATHAILGSLQSAPSAAINAVLLFNGLGDIDRAFAVAEAYLLEKGPLIASVRWREGQVSINDQRRRKTQMLFTPVSAPMRADPRFQRLAQDIGLAAYWNGAGVAPDYLA